MNRQDLEEYYRKKRKLHRFLERIISNAQHEILEQIARDLATFETDDND